jgi:Glycosyl hydrolase family 26
LLTRFLSLMAAAAAAVVVAVAVPRTFPAHPVHPTPAAADRPEVSIRPAAHYLGVVTPSLAAFDKQTGTRPNLAVRYLPWGAPLSLALLRSNASLGAETLAEIEPTTRTGQPVSFGAIIAGRYDRWLRSVGRAISASGQLMMVSFAPEGNGNWYPWGATFVTAAAYVAAWRHVHDIVSVRGARITWLWQEAPQGPGVVPLSTVWPGSRYVDLAGLDAYLYMPPDSISSVFGPSVTVIRSFTGVPVLIAETAAGPVVGQARSIPGMFADVRSLRLAGLVWFDINQDAGIYHQAWALTGAASLAAWRAGARVLTGRGAYARHRAAGTRPAGARRA